ncbi:MAG: hypothetical protein JNL11_06425 [Bdellovibrionaceae bacterium]|nr:hypothetical protein [Pseudobdellovibrionaceae bacterium]
MSLIKIIISVLVLAMSLSAQVKPVVNGSNIKAYMNAIHISLLNNRQWVHFKFSAQGIAYPTGEVRLIYPKLVLGRDHYGIELDPRSSAASTHFQAVSAVADSICAVMGRKPLRKGAHLNAAVYLSEFRSVKIDRVNVNMVLPQSVTFNADKRYILDSIICI